MAFRNDKIKYFFVADRGWICKFHQFDQERWKVNGKSDAKTINRVDGWDEFNVVIVNVNSSTELMKNDKFSITEGTQEV